MPNFLADYVTDSNTVNVYAERADPKTPAKPGNRMPDGRPPMLVYVPKELKLGSTIRVTVELLE